jgi:hypothetical protein
MLLIRGALGPLSQRATLRAMPEVERLAQQDQALADRRDPTDRPAPVG